MSCIVCVLHISFRHQVRGTAPDRNPEGDAMNDDFGIRNEDNGENDPALDKVRKLLAKAESTDSEAERDALNARANALIAKYGIDKAMASQGRISDDDMALKEYEIRGDYADEIARLLVSLGNALGCQGILTYEGATDIGYVADIARLEVLYT